MHEVLLLWRRLRASHSRPHVLYPNPLSKPSAESSCCFLALFISFLNFFFFHNYSQLLYSNTADPSRARADCFLSTFPSSFLFFFFRLKCATYPSPTKEMLYWQTLALGIGAGVFLVFLPSGLQANSNPKQSLYVSGHIFHSTHTDTHPRAGILELTYLSACRVESLRSDLDSF